MRSYNKVGPGFWTSPTVRKLSDDARHLFLYLITCPHNSILGMFRAPLGYMMADMGWEGERVREGLRELSQVEKPSGSKGVITWDEQSEVLLIHTHLKHNPLQNPNQVKKAITFLGSLPRSPKLFAELLKRLEREPKDNTEPLRKQLRKGLPKGSPNPEPEQEPEQEPEKEAPEPGGPGPAAGGGCSPGPGFEDFWKGYPIEGKRNASKKKARERWRAATKRAGPETIIAGMERMAAQWEAREPGLFVPQPPYPEKFLSEDRWEAAYDMPVRDGPRGAQAGSAGSNKDWLQLLEAIRLSGSGGKGWGALPDDVKAAANKLGDWSWWLGLTNRELGFKKNLFMDALAEAREAKRA